MRTAPAPTQPDDLFAGERVEGSGDASERRRPRLVASFLAGGLVAAASFGLGVTLASEESSQPDTVVAEVSPTEPTLASVTQGVASVAQALSPSVVQVETNAGLGSGVVYAPGLVLTNHHVIDGANQIVIRTADGRTAPTELVGSDARNDIAVLRLTSELDLPVAPLADGTQPLVGETAIAIGSPFQLQQTVTAGIVSALNRPVPNQGGGISAMIQTDASINPGNSGGALANDRGEVIGINTSIRTDGTSNSNVGIGFAVPIDRALDVADRIVSGQDLSVGVLGVTSATEPDNAVGVVIGEVVEDGPAAAAGVITGDRLIAIDGAPVTNFVEVVGLVQSNFGGDEVVLLIDRNGSEIIIRAILE